MFLFYSSEQKAARKAESCDVTWSVIQDIVLAHIEFMLPGLPG